MRKLGCQLLLLLALLPGWVQAAAAQVGRAAVGGSVGAAGGAVITLSLVVARARLQGEFLHSPEDLIHWQSAPMIITPAVGVMFGLAGREPLIGSMIGSASGLVVGGAIGAGLGWLLSDDQQWTWAGGVLGASAGMTIGGLFMGFSEWAKKDDDEPPGASGPVLQVRIPF